MSKTKSISYLLVSIILTLGLSISLQSLLAQWTAPTDAPPDGNVSGLLTKGVTNENQSIAGGIGIEQNLTVDDTDEVLGVDTVTNRVGIGTIHPEVDLDVDGSVRIRDLSSCASGKVDVDGDGDLICGTDAVNDADADATNEIQGIMVNQGLRTDTNDNFGLKLCALGQILKNNGANWYCASDNVGISSETDPNVPAFVKDGAITWSEITGDCPCGECWKKVGSCNNHKFCSPAGWIYLNPADNCQTCFIKGTQVLMADGTYKSIEDVKIGEKVQGVNGSINTVLAYERPTVGGRNTYIINGKVEFTGDHPFLSTEGWKVADLELFHAHPRELGEDPTQLKIGDTLITKDGEVTVETLEVRTDRPFDEEVYDLKLDGTKTYIANDFIVHNC